MKMFSSVPFFILPAVLIAASPAIAEKVEHHGNVIETGGSAKSCILCHDGALARKVSFCTVKCDFSTSHSLYKKYPPHGKKASYAPVADVKTKGIRVENGRVTCISCHNLKNKTKNHLVLDDQGRLCAICHIKE